MYTTHREDRSFHVTSGIRWQYHYSPLFSMSHVCIPRSSMLKCMSMRKLCGSCVQLTGKSRTFRRLRLFFLVCRSSLGALSPAIRACGGTPGSLASLKTGIRSEPKDARLDEKVDSRLVRGQVTVSRR
ncbi:hypothetical protein M413DRAFT_357995 [Hebeloma cylindrosporum]|uniref:Uncharacterized protein n=1 Tax=Hebeloma cylindrosporum TaxID=76867 RepID=A0A0C3C701_HEBCY|nr:hypothetical protein M413DRAFT_357995 [Hebeloma cylindrosporum h7]